MSKKKNKFVTPEFENEVFNFCMGEENKKDYLKFANTFAKSFAERLFGAAKRGSEGVQFQMTLPPSEKPFFTASLVGEDFRRCVDDVECFTDTLTTLSMMAFYGFVKNIEKAA